MKTDEKIIINKVQKTKRILASWGFSLEQYQPHISGERKLKSRDKLVLIGHDSTGRRVVIKTSDKAEEKAKISREREISQELAKVASVIKGLRLPKEILFKNRGYFTFLITEFIDQPRVFVTHSLNEQFKMITKAIESMEAANLQKFNEITGGKPSACGVTVPTDYYKDLGRYIKFINANNRDRKLALTLESARQVFLKNTGTIAKFSGHLVHEDFCPHNFRVRDGKLYVLDHTAVNFGNKYLTWARFLNYMALHNPPLEKGLLRYLKEKRAAEDMECLRLFRIYKTIFLIMYYVKISKKVSGKLLKLAGIRIDFWHNFLNKLMGKKSLSKGDLSRYLNLRDSLRSNEEKKRQKEFAVA